MTAAGVETTKSGFLIRDTIEKRSSKDPGEWPPYQTDQLIEGWDPSCQNAWSYDMRLGSEAYLSTKNKVTPLNSGDSIFIKPGEFALLLTQEKLHIPRDLVAFISLRFSYAVRGLVNVSGFHVDPGFNGYIAFSVYNAGPNTVVLRSGDRVFMVVFTHLEGLVEEEPRKGSIIGEDLTRLESSWVASVKGPPVSLLALSQRVDRLVNLVEAFIAIVGIVAASLIVYFVIGVR